MMETQLTKKVRWLWVTVKGLDEGKTYQLGNAKVKNNKWKDKHNNELDIDYACHVEYHK